MAELQLTTIKFNDPLSSVLGFSHSPLHGEYSADMDRPALLLMQH